MLCVAMCLGWGHSASATSAMRLTAGKSVGTAVLVKLDDAAWLLTAYHVIKGHHCDSARICVALAVQNSPAIALASVAKDLSVILPELGIVAFEVTSSGLTSLAKVGVTPALLGPQVFGAGASVVAVGNPTIRILNQESAPFNYIGSGTVSLRRSAGSLLPPTAVQPATADTDLLFVDGFTITHGFSGGPLFLQGELDGRLVGLVEGGDAKQRNRSWAVPADIIYERLKSRQGAIERDKPFRSSNPWPADGFKDDNVYGNILGFNADADDRVRISGITPTPLPPIPLGGAIRVGVIANFADDAAYRQTFIQPLPPPGLRIDASHENLGHANGTGMLQLEWSIEATRDAPFGKLTIPFEIRTGAERQLVGQFDIGVSVANPHAVAFSLQSGFDYSSVDGTPLFSPHVFGEFELGFLIAPRRRLLLVPRVGFGYASLYASQKTLAQNGVIMGAKEEGWHSGVRVQALVELRWLKSKAVTLGVASGIVYESFVERTRNDSADPAELSRTSIPLEFPVTYRWLVVRPRVSYYLTNPRLNNKHTGIVTIVPVDSDSGFGAGVDFGGELWF